MSSKPDKWGWYKKSDDPTRLRPIKHHKCGCGAHSVTDGNRRNRERLLVLKLNGVNDEDIRLWQFRNPRNMPYSKFCAIIENSRRKRERIKAAREYKKMQDAEVPER